MKIIVYNLAMIVAVPVSQLFEEIGLIRLVVKVLKLARNGRQTVDLDRCASFLFSLSGAITTLWRVDYKPSQSRFG